MTNHLPFDKDELDPRVVKKIVDEALDHFVRVEPIEDQGCKEQDNTSVSL